MRRGDGVVLDDYFVWLEGDVAHAIPVTAKNEFVLVRQYKHASGQILIEFPAGYIEQDEDPEKGARRELKEETGFTGENFELLTTLTHNPTKVVGKHHLFLVRGAKLTASTQFDESEDIEVMVLGYREALRMIRSGEIVASATIAGIYMACARLGLSTGETDSKS